MAVDLLNTCDYPVIAPENEQFPMPLYWNGTFYPSFHVALQKSNDAIRDPLLCPKLCPSHSVPERAQNGTQPDCPEPCPESPGTVRDTRRVSQTVPGHGLGQGNCCVPNRALSQTMPGHGLGHTARVPNRALGLSTVLDTRGLSRIVPDRTQFWTHKGLVPFRALGVELIVLREEPSRGRAQFWTRDGLVPNHARARSGTLSACPEPCLGTKHSLGHADALSQTVLMGMVWDTSACPKPCLGKIYILGHAGDYPEPCLTAHTLPGTVLDSQAVSRSVPAQARNGTGTVWDTTNCARSGTVRDSPRVSQNVRHGLGHASCVPNHAQKTEAKPLSTDETR
ncbi:hypothetical protein Bbelb_133180 [Branchiostoma belcheri]|nr:hypothetical protein Bbelb_133180 [Branchiostoma belcheri]